MIDPNHNSSVGSGPNCAKTCPGWVTVWLIRPVLNPPSIRKIRPRTILVIGPTMAIRNSAPAEVGSRSILETPPNRNRVIRRTGIPRAFATSEWASSWARTELKNNSAATMAIPQSSPGLQSGCQAGKAAAANCQVTNRKMKIQLQSMVMLMPASRARRNPLRITNHPSWVCG